jgi:autotransporter-associated beta strand protein
MPDKIQRCFWASIGVLISGLLCVHSANAQTVTWGVNGAGGGGAWNKTTANWFDGGSNVPWPSGGSAIFAGSSGGTVTASTFPVVSSMTFNTPGYVIQGSFDVGTNVLTVTTNVDATISATAFFNASGTDTLVKNGPAPLTMSGATFVDNVQVNQGEFQITRASAVDSRFNLADAPGVLLTLAPTSGAEVDIFSLAGGGNAGGIVQPNNQARTVTLDVFANGGSFNGVLQNNGAGILGLTETGLDQTWTQTLTNVNSYSGPTAIRNSALIFAGSGSALSSAMKLTGAGELVLDNSGAVVSDRVSNSLGFTMTDGALRLIGNNTTPVQEVMGTLSAKGAATITVDQPGSAAAQLTFAGLQRQGSATVDVVGPGVLFTGLANGGAGIVAPYVTAGNEWATVAADNRIAPFNAYTTDINAGTASDNVKIAVGATTSLAAATTKASLNLQNSSAAIEQVLDLAGRGLQLTTGGILSSGAGANEIRSGSLSTTAQEMIVIANNNLTIGASIIDGGGATTFTKSGTGVLTLTGANTYTGPTEIMQGTLVVSSDANLGNGSSVVLGAATLKAAADFTSTKGIALGSATEGSIDTDGHQVEFFGPISFLAKDGLGTLTLSNQFPGTCTVDQGVLSMPNVLSGSATLVGGTLQVAGSLATLANLATSGMPTLDIGGPAAAILYTDSFISASIAGLRGQLRRWRAC